MRQLCISRSQRTKRKSVTVVVGLKTFGKWYLLEAGNVVYVSTLNVQILI